MRHYCGQCGRETYFEGLCDACKAHCDELEANTRRAAEAAEEQSAAEWARVMMEEEREERREARRLEKTRRSVTHGIIDLSKQIEELLPGGPAPPDQIRTALTQITGVNRDLEDWEILLSVDSHGIELAYSRLRRRILPSLAAVWKKRKELQPSPERLVKEFANGFLYPDIVEAVDGRRRVEAARERLGTAQSEHRSNESEAARLYAEGERSRLVAILAGAGAGGALLVLPTIQVAFGLAFLIALVALGFAGFCWVQGDAAIKASLKRRQDSKNYKSKIAEAEQALAEEQRRLNALGDRQLCQLLGHVMHGNAGSQSPSASTPTRQLAGEANHPLVSKPSALPSVELANGVSLRLFYTGEWYPFDAKVQVFFDGQLVGRGTANTGFDIYVDTNVGRHKIAVATASVIKRAASHVLRFPEDGSYEVQFYHSRMWGNFSPTPKVVFKGSRGAVEGRG